MASQKLSLNLFDFSPIGMSLSTLKDGRYIDVNAEACRIYGSSREEMIGRTAADLGVWVNPESRDQMVSLLRAEGFVSNLEIEVRLKSGKCIPMLMSSTILEVDDELCILTSALDISDRKRNEEETKKLEQQLWQIKKGQSLDRMAGAIAHNFNNQLAVVIGNLEMALNAMPADGPERQKVIRAFKAATRCAETSGLMLTYIGQSNVECKPIDLSDTCRRSLPALERLVPNDVTLKTDCVGTGLTIRAVAAQINQVATHLIKNAAEAIGSRGGEISLATRISPATDISQFNLTPPDWQPDADRYACLEVTDTGCGIADENKDKIFDPFFSTHITGRGLGLAVILGIARHRKGAISFESKQGHGTTFQVFFPLIEGQIHPTPQNEHFARPIPPRRGILLVDDEAMTRTTAKDMLQYLGHSVLAVSSGAEAVDIFKHNRNDIACVITDLTMPGMDGWETISALRQIDRAIPILLISGYDEATTMNRDQSERPQGFLHKPFRLNDLKTALNAILSNG